VPALRLSVEFHLFLTALSVRPGSSLAITAAQMKSLSALRPQGTGCTHAINVLVQALT
jgi:hypothetical protein